MTKKIKNKDLKCSMDLRVKHENDRRCMDLRVKHEDDILENCHSPLDGESRKAESGRSMVEMLGTLAIIGVLSVGGIAGYTHSLPSVQQRFQILCECVMTFSL